MKIKIELEEEQWGYVLDAISESEAKALKECADQPYGVLENE